MTGPPPKSEENSYIRKLGMATPASQLAGLPQTQRKLAPASRLVGKPQNYIKLHKLENLVQAPLLPGWPRGPKIR